MTILKAESELKAMRRSCRVAALVLDELCRKMRPGITTKEVDQWAADLIKMHGGTSAFLGYRKYPGHICISVNDQVVHGIGSNRMLQFGDLVSLDVGVRLGEFIGDNAKTVAIGGCGLDEQRLLDVTEHSLYDGIKAAVAGHKVQEIGRAIQNTVEENGFSIVREFVGHGVGRTMHEEPQIPNFVDTKCSAKLKRGMTIAIEPMVNAGRPEVRILSDGWTVVTRDGSKSAHFEHTVLVTDGTAEILTCIDEAL